MSSGDAPSPAERSNRGGVPPASGPQPAAGMQPDDRTSPDDRSPPVELPPPPPVRLATEVLAGLVTFLTMAYILLVHPSILAVDFTGQPTGMNWDAVFIATAISAGIASIAMGLYARLPIALAPGMGQNAIFVMVIMALPAAGVAGGYRAALGMVFIAGVLFLILSLLPIRKALIEVLSASQRHAAAVGIGLFIAIIGLSKGGLVPLQEMKLQPNLMTPDVAVFAAGLLVTAGLMVRRVPGAILIGIIAAMLVATPLGLLAWPTTLAGWIGLVGLPDFRQSHIFSLDIPAALAWQAWPFILIFLFVALFDATGTLIALGEQSGLVQNGELPRTKEALIVDSGASIVGACVGTSTLTCYIESAAGIEQGGRTGRVAIVVGILFFAALFFAPLIKIVGGCAPITAAALVVVGAMMAKSVTRIDWEDAGESIPAFLLIVGIPLTYSIADGLAISLSVYPFIKLIGGRYREVHWLSYVLAVLLVLYLLFVRSRL